MNLSHFIDDWMGLTVLVIGDVMLDCYLCGSSDRLCQEAPVPVVAISSRHDAPGGAANTAANVRSLGGQAVLLSVIGNDLEGDRLRQLLSDRGVSTEHLLTSDRATLAKQRILADSHLLVRFDQGSTEVIPAEIEQRLIDRLSALFSSCSAILVSDYGYGVLTPRLIQTLGELQAQHPKPIVVDSKQLGAYRSIGVTAVKPNYSEATQLLGLKKLKGLGRAEQIAAGGERLLETTGAAIVAVTLDQEGAIIFERGQPPHRTYAQPASNAQATGAGDTFVSALTLALAAGAPTASAASLAAAATAVVVTQEGTTACDTWELRQLLLSDKKQASTLAELVGRVKRHRAAGRRIVLTNGCFDILHQGQVAYLNQAKALGDVLIVGVNTDETVRQLKGADRPVNPLSDRLVVLAALSCVDYVVPFAEEIPYQLIRAVQPDVFAKGGNYTRDLLPEASLVEELGGEVVILPLQGDRTASLIQRIRQSYA